MNATIKTIYDRRAVRRYKNIPVEQEVIEQLLDAGRMAPSAMHKQPWKFYVLTDKRLISDFDKEIKSVAKKVFAIEHGIDFLKSDNPIFHGAPVVIFITAQTEDEWAALDIGMCAQNMMLAAKSMGLDTCPVGLGRLADQTNLYSLLDVDSSEQLLFSLIVGYGDENPVFHERRKDNVVYISPVTVEVEDYISY